MKSSQKLEQTKHIMQPQHPQHTSKGLSHLTIDPCIPVFTGALFRVPKLCTYAHAPSLACGGHISLTFMWIPRANLGCQALMARALHAEPFYQPHSCLSYLCVREWNFLLHVGPYRICSPMLVSHFLFVCVPFKRG